MVYYLFIAWATSNEIWEILILCSFAQLGSNVFLHPIHPVHYIYTLSFISVEITRKNIYFKECIKYICMHIIGKKRLQHAMLTVYVSKGYMSYQTDQLTHGDFICWTLLGCAHVINEYTQHTEQHFGIKCQEEISVSRILWEIIILVMFSHTLHKNEVFH